MFQREVCNKVYSTGSSVSVLRADMGNSEVGHNALGEASGPCLFTNLLRSSERHFAHVDCLQNFASSMI